MRRISRTRRRRRTLAGPLLAAVMALLGLIGTGASTAAAAAGEQATYRTQGLPPGAAVATSAAAGQSRAPGTRTRIDLKADSRFSLAALRWPSGAAAITGRLRAQRIDGSWTAWSDLESDAAGDDGVVEGSDPAKARAARAQTAVLGREGSTEPIWTGPARRLQVELTSRRPAGLRAAFVDVRGQVPAVAHAARAQIGDQAGIQPRTAWDPDNDCRPRATAAIGSVQAVVVHHTVGTNDYTQAQVPAVILAICKFHRNGNGWNDIGYNVLVDRFDGAWEGRAGGLTNAVIGAQAQGFNAVTAGVSMLGDFTAVSPSSEQVATVARVAAWKLAIAGVPRSGAVDLVSAGGSLSRYKAGDEVELPRVVGHRDVGLTACPGNTGYLILNGVRAAVAAANPVLPAMLPPAIAPAPAPVKLTINTAKRVTAGDHVVVTGTATQGAAPLKGAAVALQVGSGTSWQSVMTARTTTDGKFRFARKFSRSWQLRVVRTDGDGGTSAAVAMQVVPTLTLTVPRRMRLGKRITLRGTIAPGRGPVTLLVERRVAATGKYVASPPQITRLKGRVITVSITPHSATLYRFRLRYAGSELAAPARSPLAFGRAVKASGKGGGVGV